MKGIIFRAFIDHVEDRYGLAVADAMISGSDLGNQGAYTSVGTYDPAELIKMIGCLSQQVGTDVAGILKEFGTGLFQGLVDAYPKLVVQHADSFSLIEAIETNIHVEVRKLYPDAELPSFSHQLVEPDRMILIYSSSRGLADFAEGLLRGCFDYFGDTIDLQREDLSAGKNTKVRFDLKHRRIDDGRA